jgi:hypothetical protein
LHKGRIRGWRRAGRWFVSRAEILGMFQRVTPPQQPTVPGLRERRRIAKEVEEGLRAFGAW